MDPATLGTLILGLEDVNRHQPSDPQRTVQTARPPRRSRIAAALSGAQRGMASTLRSMADALEPGQDGAPQETGGYAR
jgi:hypothetical protein